jgi:AraC-like DNA-binding protein
MDNPLIIGLTTGTAFLLSFLLINAPKNNNRHANIWLGVFMATLTGAFLEIFIHNLNLQKQYTFTLDMLQLCRFLSAPTMYLSILFFTNPNKVFTRKDLWHFVPFTVFFAFRMSSILMAHPDAVGRGADWQFPNETMQFIVFAIIRNALPLQTIMYWILSYRKLQKHRRNIEKISATVDTINLDWLRYFLLILSILVIIWLNLAIFNITSLYDFTPYIYLASVFFLAHFALRQREIYPYEKHDLKELSAVIEDSNTPEKTKYQRLTDTETTVLKDTLNRLMQYEKVYLDNELSLPQLAEKMAISPQDLSYLINEAYGENFFSFINRHRVEEVKRLLLTEKYDQFNILGIAYQAGFNSKTTFNAAFKKQVGQSPSDFVKTSKMQKQEKNN